MLKSERILKEINKDNFISHEYNGTILKIDSDAFLYYETKFENYGMKMNFIITLINSNDVKEVINKEPRKFKIYNHSDNCNVAVLDIAQNNNLEYGKSFIYSQNTIQTISLEEGLEKVVV